MKLWKSVGNAVTPTHENVYRPHLLGRSSLVFFVALTLAVEGFLVASLVARQSDGTFLSAVVASDIISVTNADRQQSKISNLQENPKLDAAAQAKANDMAAKGYFAHVGPDGTLPWAWILSAGYGYKMAGENLAVRFTDSKDVVRAWMASPSHRANILKPPYKDIGVGVANGMYQGQPATFVVQYFGVEDSSAAPVSISAPSNGAVVAASSGGSFLHSIERQFSRILNDPAQTINWILGSIAVLLFAVVLIAFVMHIEVQSREMLLGGVVVATLALLCVAANGKFLSSAISAQTAGVIQAFDENDSTFGMSGGQ